MSKQMIELIERKIADLQEQVKKQNSDLVEATNAIDKLIASKSTATNNLNILSGAIQAYADVLQILKSSEETEVEMRLQNNSEMVN